MSANGTVVVAAIGDSITAGSDCDHPSLEGYRRLGELGFTLP